MRKWFSIKSVSLFFVAAIFIFMGVLGSREYEKWVEYDIKNRVESTLEIYDDSLEGILSRYLERLNSLEEFVNKREDKEILRDFPIFAPGLHNNLPGLRNIGIAPQGILSLIYPTRGNEAAIEYNLLADLNPKVIADVNRAITSKEIVVTDPFELRQGGLGIAERKVIFKKGNFWGLISLVVDVPIVIEDSGLNKEAVRLDLALRDKTGKVFWGDEKVFEMDPIIRRIDMIDGYWELAGINFGGWENKIANNLRIFRLIELLFGGLILILIGMLFKRDTSLVIADEKMFVRTKSLRIVAIYFVVSITWIFYSDRALTVIFTDTQLINELQTLKGWLFVVISSLILYWLIEANYGRYLVTSRALRSILAGNRMLFRAKTEKDLYNGICEELVGQGGYDMAWVGVEKEEKTLIPVGTAGKKNGFFDEFTFSWKDGGIGSPCITAIRMGKSVIVNDISEVTSYPEWREAAKKSNFKSLLALPLIENDKAIGLIAIYSSKLNAFSYGDLELLTGFANDLVYGLKTIQLRRERNKNEEFINKVLREMADAVFVIDDKGIIVMVNKAAERLTGYKVDRLIGQNFKERVKVVFEKNDESGSRLIEKILKTGSSEVPPENLVLIDEAGTKLGIDFMGTPIKDEKNKVKGIILILRDVTSQRKLDKIKNDFVSLASHQLRSPLTGIKWFVELLLDGKTKMKPKITKEYIEKIGESNERLIDLVNDLLITSKMEEGKYDKRKFEKVKVRDLLREALKQEERPMVDKDTSVKGIDRIPDKVTIEADHIQMVQVFSNLLDNAINYSPINSKVIVRVEQRPAEIIVSVKDSGLGIPRGQQKNIFEKFFRADNVAKTNAGSGLGLYMTKNIVAGHGGRIWFESTEGKGTTFFVKLPIKQKKDG